MASTTVYKYVNKTNKTITTENYVIGPYGGVVLNTPALELDRLDGIYLDKYLDGVAVHQPTEYNTDNVIIAKEAQRGIRLDYDQPEFGWHDLLSPTTVYSGASNELPTFDTFAGNIRGYRFAVGDATYHNFHIPHDFLLGSEAYIHVHWLYTGNQVTSGSTTWNFEVTVAKGYGQAQFSTPKIIPVTQAGTVLPGTHMIAETKLLTNSGQANLIDTALVEVDSLIIVKTSLAANSLTPTTDPFMLFCDIHYQSTGIPTYNKNPNFYA